MSFCTTAQIKTHAVIAGASFDSAFDQILLQVEQVIEERTGLLTDSAEIVNQVTDSSGFCDIQTRNHPINSLTKIEYRDTNNDWAEYTDEAIGDVEFEGDRIYPEYLAATKGRRRLRISYNAGYNTADVPADLQLAAILMSLKLFTERNSVGLSESETLGLQLKFTQKDHDYVQKILKKYSQIYAL